MLQPKKVKHRKAHKGRIRGEAQRGATVAFGSFGLKALEPKWITNRQIEARAPQPAMATTVDKIKAIEEEMAKTQKNKATSFHLGQLKAKLAKL